MSERTEEEQRLVEWLADMNEDDALALARRMLLEEGKDPLRVLALCREAMDVVGKRFSCGRQRRFFFLDRNFLCSNSKRIGACLGFCER